MTAKLSFCLKAATTLGDQDLAAITDSIEAYARGGMDMRQAEAAAVDDVIAQVAAERTELVALVKEQHPEQFKSDRAPVEPPAAPAAPASFDAFTFLPEEAKVEQPKPDAKPVLPPTAPAVDTPAFKKWFGDSKIVNADGSPKVMYHGTAQHITEFRPQQADSIFLTDDPRFAETFAIASEGWMRNKGQAGTPVVMPLYVKAENTFDFRSSAARAKVADAAFAKIDTHTQGDGQVALVLDGKPTLYTRPVLEEAFKKGEWLLIEDKSIQAVIRELGYDSYRVLEDGRVNLAVYRSNQVKSASKNSGAFDAANPDIRMDIADKTDTPAFKAWFGGSKVVDADGKPLVVHHGTGAADISKFDLSRIGQNGRSEGPGIYFTTDADIAKAYGQKGSVIDAYLSIKKPLDYKAKAFSQAQMRKLIEEVAKVEQRENGDDWKDGFLSNYVDTYSMSIEAAAREAAKSFAGETEAIEQIGGIIGSGVDAEIVNDALTAALGYDGYRSDGFSGEGNKGGVIWVAMRSQQIKSATGNAGTFDPANADIRMDKGEAADFDATQLPTADVVAETPVNEQSAKAVEQVQQLFSKMKAFKGLDLQALPDLAEPGEKDSAAVKDRYAAVELFRHIYGKKVVAFSANRPFANGLFDSRVPDTLFLNEATKRPVMALLGHELLHSMRNDNPALYDKLVQRLDALLKEPGRYIDALNARYEAHGISALADDKAHEELVADIVGDFHTDPQFWRDMAAGQPALFQRVLGAVREFFNQLLRRLKSEKPYGTEQYLSDVRAARGAVATVMGEYAAQRSTGPAGAKTEQAALSIDDNVTGTTAFKKWFGASKVVDEKGQPQVMFHGTSNTERGEAFTFFDSYGSNYGLFGQGSYFTADPAVASSYTTKGRGASPTVYPVYMSIKNPIDMDSNVTGENSSVAAWEKAFPDVDFQGTEREPRNGSTYTNEDFYRIAEDHFIEEQFERYEAAEALQEGLRSMGYDGITHVGGGRVKSEGVKHRVFIAFEPEQIKSAIGNSGAFDPSKADIRFSLPDYTDEQRAALAKAGIDTRTRLQRAGDRIRAFYPRIAAQVQSNWGRQFQQGFVDQFTGISQVVKRELGGLPVEQDPYVAARLANGGTSSVMRGLLLHGQARWAANKQHLEKIPGTKGLLEILEPLGPDVNDFFGWMIGHRAARLMAEGRENNFTAADIEALKGLGKGKEDKFRAAALQYAAFKRSVLDIGEQAGLIKGESRKVWDQADYIPFYRQIDEKAVFGATGKKGLAGQSSGIRQLRGGEAALNDPMENIIMNFSRLIDASLKNNAIVKTTYLLQEADSDVITKVGYDMSQQMIPADQVRKALEQAGTHPAVIDMIPAEVFDGMAKMWAIQAPTDPDVIRVMRDGKPEFWRVNEPLLLKALTSFVPFDFPGLGLMRAFKRLLTGAVTATPEFMIRNFIRDSVATQMVGKDGINPLKSITGIVKSYTEAGGFENMLFAGASFQSGQINAGDPVATAKAARRALRKKGFAAASQDISGTILDTPQKFWEAYRHVGEAIENANREAVYEATQKAGKSDTAAAFESKDLMDFTLRGSSPIYQVMADVLPFFNARVQGMYRLGRANPKRLATYGMLMLAASVMLVLANGDNPEYDQLPDWDKDTYWHVWIGGKHFRIPKPFELGVAFATLPERVTQYVKGHDSGKKLIARVFANIRDQLAIDPVPQLLRPGLNAAYNHDSFRDRPIETMSDEGKLPSRRFGPYTSATARKAVDVLNVHVPGTSTNAMDAIGLSPKKLEYLVGGYLGTTGLYALGLSDMAVKAMEGAPPSPKPRMDDYPVIRSFYRMEPARATQFESDFYELRTHIEQVYKTIMAEAKDGNVEKATALRDQNIKQLAVRDAVADVGKRLTLINKARDNVYLSREMTPLAKRTELDRLQTLKNDLLRRAMKQPAIMAAQ